MSYDIVCRACGKSNPLGRLYCMSCGARLEVSEDTISRARQAGPAGASLPARILRLLVTLALLLALVQLLRPVAPESPAGVADDAVRLERKLNDLQRATRQSGHAEHRISEAELNAYFRELIKQTPVPTDSPLGLDLKSVHFTTTADGRILVLIETRRDPLVLTQEIEVAPARAGDRWTYTVEGMRMGHLPVPRALAVKLAARSAGAFNNLQRQRELLDRLPVLEIKAGWIRVATGETGPGGRS